MILLCLKVLDSATDAADTHSRNSQQLMRREPDRSSHLFAQNCRMQCDPSSEAVCLNF
jgi:hypothetical protein